MKTPTHLLPGLILITHVFTVPLDHTQPDGAKIEIFAREAVSPRYANNPEALPWLVFFQGGPGSAAPRPSSNSGWLKRALQDYRVLLLDQRGTGQMSRKPRSLQRPRMPEIRSDPLAPGNAGQCTAQRRTKQRTEEITGPVQMLVPKTYTLRFTGPLRH